MKKILVFCLTVFIVNTVFAQGSVGIGTTTPNTSAQLDIASTGKGVLIPRLSKSQRNSIITPAKGLLVFIDDTDSAGFHFYDGSKWVWMQANDVTDTIFWKRKGNAGTNPAVNFIGTTDNTILNFRVNNIASGRIDHIKSNTFLGYRSGLNNTTGFKNIFLGDSAGKVNTTGTTNIFIGVNSGAAMGGGAGNVFIGDSTGASLTTGDYSSVFIGDKAGSKTTAMPNTFVGNYAGRLNQGGNYNCFVGTGTGTLNTSGIYNTFLGELAGSNNSFGNNNVFAGTYSGTGNVSGFSNVFIGEGTGSSNVNGYFNVLIGTGANVFSDGIANAVAIGTFSRVDTSDAFVLGSVNGINGATVTSHIGIGTTKPLYPLHVVNNKTNDGGWAQGIVVENTSPLATAGEAAISFRNTAITLSKQWNVGINQSSTNLAFNYGVNFAGGSTRMAIDTFGNVGIGTITPLARLHVKDSSVLFISAATLPVTAGNPPLSGSGNRMMWYADKAAFRAGGIPSDEWDNINIGLYSAAFGFANKAAGPYSFASGYGNTTLGTASFSAGQSNSVATDYSSALGTQNNVSGIESAAVGVQNNVSGFVSHAIGALNTVSGSQNIAIGTQNDISGSGSQAIGLQNIVPGTNAIAMGFSNESDGSVSIAMGNFTRAIGDKSTTMGFNTKAKSFASVVIGQYNDTTSTNSTSWVTTDPVFVIGNGLTSSARTNAMTVLKNGNTGINTSSPQDMLDVNGTTRLGTNGTALSEIIKVTVSKNVAAISANSSGTESFSVANAQTTSTVYISPASSLTDGLTIAYARVSAAGNVEVKFTNTTGAVIDPPAMNFYITVIR
jgi:hypothetical protein